MTHNFAYEVTGPGSDLFGVVDLNTGVFTPIGSMGLTLAGIGSYGGVIYGGAYHGSTLYSVNTSTGALTVIGTGNISYADFGSTTSGLFAFGDNGDLYSINPTNGAATDIGPTGLSFGGIVMGMSSGSSTLYLTQNNSLYSLNTSDGHATLIATTNEGESGFGALVSVHGTLYGGAYDASTPDLYTVNPRTGGTTFVAASPSTPSAPGVAGFWGLAPITPGGNEIANGHHHDEAASGLEANNGADTFYFPPNFGNTVITQFNVQTDVIDLPKSEFPNLAAVFADAHQVGANTVISYDAHDSITLNNVALTDLHAQNFHLV